MNQRTNPYEPVTSVDPRDRDVKTNRTPIDLFPISWKIATAVGMMIGYFAWYALAQLVLMSSSVSWIVQGGFIAIGLIPASVFFRVREQETITQSIVQNVLPTSQIMAVWSVAASVDFWLSPQLALTSWMLTLALVMLLDLMLVKTTAPTQSRRMAILSLTIYCVTMLVCLAGLVL